MIVYWWCLMCHEHGDGDRQAEKHTQTTLHPTMTSIHPRPDTRPADVRYHEVPD